MKYGCLQDVAGDWLSNNDYEMLNKFHKFVTLFRVSIRVQSMNKVHVYTHHYVHSFITSFYDAESSQDDNDADHVNEAGDDEDFGVWLCHVEHEACVE